MNADDFLIRAAGEVGSVSRGFVLRWWNAFITDCTEPLILSYNETGKRNLRSNFTNFHLLRKWSADHFNIPSSPCKIDF